MSILVSLAVMMLNQVAPNPPVVLAKDLQTVTGPLTPKYPDPALGIDYHGLGAEIRRSARHGSTLPALAVPPLPITIQDNIQNPAGWKAYRIEVAPKATVKARLHGIHQAWFLVKCVDKWGHAGEGTLQNRIPTGNPEASFINPKNENVTMFFIVDTKEMDITGEEFTLTFTTPGNSGHH